MWLPSTLRLVAATALLLLPQTLAAPLEARAQMDEFSSGSATVQWSSAAGNNIRSYHIRDDCSVVEDSWGPGFSSWSASVLPFCGGSTAALSAVILTDPSGNPEVIQLFFRDNEYKFMKSIVWTPSVGWVADTGFNALKADATPASAIAWRSANDQSKQIRVYAHKAGMTVDVAEHFFKDQSLVWEFAWSAATGWWQTNDKRALLNTDEGYSWGGSYSAIVGPGGNWIRLFFWDQATALSSWQNDRAFINWALWTQSAGWVIQGPIQQDMVRYFSGGVKEMAVVTWGENTSSGQQIRVYAKWKNYGGTLKMAEYASDRGSWSVGQPLPDYALDRVNYAPLSVVVWPYPNPSTVHIRVYQTRCQVSGDCRAYVHEVGFDTSSGWNDGKNLPA